MTPEYYPPLSTVSGPPPHVPKSLQSIHIPASIQRTDRPWDHSTPSAMNVVPKIPGVQSFSIQPPPSYAHAPFPRSMATTATTSNPVCSFTAQPCSSLPPSFCVCASLSPVRPVVVGLVVVATAFHPSTRRPDAVFVAAGSTMSTSSFTIGDTAERTTDRTNPPVCYCCISCHSLLAVSVELSLFLLSPLLLLLLLTMTPTKQHPVGSFLGLPFGRSVSSSSAAVADDEAEQGRAEQQ